MATVRAVQQRAEALADPAWLGQATGSGAIQLSTLPWRGFVPDDVAARLGWRPTGRAGWKDLEEFRLARAIEHDAPSALFRPGCQYRTRGCRVWRTVKRGSWHRDTHGEDDWWSDLIRPLSEACY